MLQRMIVESLNVGRPETVEHGKTALVSGIRKRSVGASTSLLVGELGVQNDAIVDDEHHGGPDQAVYAYSADDYDWWNATHGTDFAAGAFGENLTIRGLPSDMNIGDRMLIGEVVLEVTGPRIPCRTLSAQVQDTGFGLAYRKAERPGIYFRVLSGGNVQQGDNVTVVATADSDVSIVELFRAYYALSHNVSGLERILAAPLACRYRDRFAAKLTVLQEKQR